MFDRESITATAKLLGMAFIVGIVCGLIGSIALLLGM